MINVAQLRAVGLSAVAASAKVRLFARAHEALDALRSDGAPHDPLAFWVPGRIEFLGKHTDYAGGRSLLCALERGISLLVTPRTDRRLRIVDAARPNDFIDAALDSAVTPPTSRWSTYPLTVAHRVALNFSEPLVGADIAFVSDLPLAAGMSSSSALVVATFLALADVNHLSERREYAHTISSPEDLAGYLGAVENGHSFGDFAGAAGVGTLGGSEDHTAILCARANALVEYTFCPVRYQRTIPLPPDHEFVIASSGVTAEKIGGARSQYNRASLAVREIVERWNELTGRRDATLAAAIDSSPGAAGKMRKMLDGSPSNAMCITDQLATVGNANWLSARFQQFVLESMSAIPQAGDALARHDLYRLGIAVDKSQAAAEQLLGNQIAETMWLARDARAHGATAASTFGAGFGGSVWALVRSDHADEFCSTWAARYAEHFPTVASGADFFRTCAGPPAARIATSQERP